MHPAHTFHQLLERDNAGSRIGQYGTTSTHPHPLLPIALVIPSYSLHDPPPITEVLEKRGIPSITEPLEKRGVPNFPQLYGVTNYPVPVITTDPHSPPPPHRLANKNHRLVGKDYDYGWARLMMEFGRHQDSRESVLSQIQPDELEKVIMMDASSSSSSSLSSSTSTSSSKSKTTNDGNPSVSSYLPPHTSMLPVVFNRRAGRHGRDFVRFPEEMNGPSCYGSAILRVLLGAGYELKWSKESVLLETPPSTASTTASSSSSSSSTSTPVKNATHDVPLYTLSRGCVGNVQGINNMVKDLKKYYDRAEQVRSIITLNPPAVIHLEMDRRNISLA